MGLHHAANRTCRANSSRPRSSRGVRVAPFPTPPLRRTGATQVARRRQFTKSLWCGISLLPCRLTHLHSLCERFDDGQSRLQVLFHAARAETKTSRWLLRRGQASLYFQKITLFYETTSDPGGVEFGPAMLREQLWATYRDRTFSGDTGMWLKVLSAKPWS
jgi:hypothetical protein